MKNMKWDDYKKSVSRALAKAGWKLAFEKIESRWFADEHWVFESVAQEYGLRIFISPIFDPQLGGSQLAYIRAGENIPSNWSDNEGLIAQLWSSSGNLKKALTAFVNEIENYRNRVHEGTSKEEA